MRFNCPQPKPYVDKRKTWHKKFAWLPTQIKPGICIWFEFYWCKGTEHVEHHWAGGYIWWDWDYRLIEEGVPLTS